MPYRPRRAATTALVFVAAGATAGALAGAALGAAGALLPQRGVMVFALAWLGAALLLADGAWRRLPLPQRDKETPKAWMDQPRLVWAVKNGASLGFGALTRIAFPVWFAIPAASLLSGGPVPGGGIYGAYGMARCLASAVLAMRSMGRPPPAAREPAGRGLLFRVGDARFLSDMVALFAVVLIGRSWA
jgi:hypothetical protein